MSVRQSRGRSAAFILLVLGITFLVGALMITILNPYWNGLESSGLFDFGTTHGQNLAAWYTTIHRWIGLIMLLAILFAAYVKTREPV